MTRYAVVVSSCDNYDDLWDPFFLILDAEWPELREKQIPIILNTESKSYSYDGLNIKTFQMYKMGDSPSWTERLRRTLEGIHEDYIIFLLDDFFMEGRVDSSKIDQHVKWMDDNKRISSFCYKETFVSRNISDGKYDGFERRPLIGKYKFNCQASLWRRDRLISYLLKDENPWEWEVFGNWRSYRHPYHVFYSHIPGQDHVFPYIHNIGGIVFGGDCVFRGKWFISSVDPIFKKHDISIDYSCRGTVTEEDFVPKEKTEKKKEDAPRWMQRLWVMRRIYLTFQDMADNVMFFFRNIDHFL